MDEAIRALARSVAHATLDYVFERLCEDAALKRDPWVRDLFEQKVAMAQEIADLVLENADEDADSEVHAVRALASEPSRTRPVGWGTT